jgi:hypothetical protein
MNYRNTLIAAAAASLASLAGSALANEGSYDKSGKSAATFDSLDTNRDGRISQAEASVDAMLTFSTADANGDGYLDKSEFKKAHKAGKSNDGSMQQPQSQPQSQSTDPSTDPSATEPVPPQDQSAPPPADTETPRQ